MICWRLQINIPAPAARTGAISAQGWAIRSAGNRTALGCDLQARRRELGRIERETMR